MLTTLAWMGRHALPLLAGGVFLGLVFPDLPALARPVLIPSVFALLVAAMVRIDLTGLAALKRAPLSMVGALIFLLLISPCLALGASVLFDLDPSLQASLVIWSASPPLVSVTAIAVLVGLNGAMALTLMTVAGLVMPFTLPPLVLGLLGLTLDIDVLELTLRLSVFIVGAALIAVLIRKSVGEARIRQYGTGIDGGFVILMLVFAVSVMDGVTDAAIRDPVRVVTILCVVFGASLLLQAVACAVFWPFGPVTAGTVALNAGNRNMAIVIGAAPAAFDPEIFLYLALLQFPIYLLPILLSPAYRALARRGVGRVS